MKQRGDDGELEMEEIEKKLNACPLCMRQESLNKMIQYQHMINLIWPSLDDSF